VQLIQLQPVSVVERIVFTDDAADFGKRGHGKSSLEQKTAPDRMILRGDGF
jgi:hypothetical protein